LPTARARVAAFLDDEEQVTTAQRAAVLHAGNFLLEACPGSGKTRTIGLRAAWISVEGAGRTVAAASYTNVAVDEIRRAAATAGAPIAKPHFVGTLHGFFLRFVFYPFGRLVMGCIGPPRLQQETYLPSEADQVPLPKQRVPVPLSRFEFRADGRVVVPEAKLPVGVTMSAEEVTRHGQQDALELKRKVAAQGVATRNDAMHYVREVLEQYPRIAAAVAARFDELIVDEAQDTNDIQLRCLQLLHATGQLGSLVLVGDFDQAIYSFSWADPSKCRQFAQTCSLQTLQLTENFRSSQAICDVTHRFSSRARPDTARGPHRHSRIRPEILRYHPRRLTDLVARYRDRLDTAGIKPEAACILVRTRSLADRFNGRRQTTDGPGVRVLGTAAVTIDAGRQPSRVTLGTVEHLLGTLAWEEPVRRSLDLQQRQALRDQTMALLNALPSLDQPINDWIAAARAGVSQILRQLTEQPAIAPGRRLQVASATDLRTARAAFTDTLPGPLQARLIHKVKGSPTRRYCSSRRHHEVTVIRLGPGSQHATTRPPKRSGSPMSRLPVPSATWQWLCRTHARSRWSISIVTEDSSWLNRSHGEG
jgi:hypothetical protein